jgi:hypothetical protein
MQMEDLLYGAADASSYTGLMAVRVASENSQLVSNFALHLASTLLMFSGLANNDSYACFASGTSMFNL